MRRTLALMPPMIAAAPAIAHDGAHIHPHGFEGWIALGAVVALAGLLIIRSVR